MQSIPNSVYYSPTSAEYDLIMNKYPFHDSGIADEGLSDDAASVEDELNQQESSEVNDDHGKVPKKPNQSYLELIAEAILKAPNRMLQLFEIYNYFQRKYQYFAADVNKSWKNSVRHNLSLNDCFVKAGRGTNGKGHFWRIHEFAESDFEQGRFRRRRYRQQMRQLHMHSPPVHQSPYGQPSGGSFYPSTGTPPYYMCSPTSSQYPPFYSTPNHSIENQVVSPNVGLGPVPPSIPYPAYDHYAASYYPMAYHSMTSSYASQHESAHVVD